MSKKGKLILATALFGAALFGASCGGGGGTASAPPSPPSPPSAPPAASNVAKVLVLAAKGITSPGATVGLFEGTVRSDGTVSWTTDLLPGENILEYCHEFSNRSVVLCDLANQSVYLYTAGTLNQVTEGYTVVGDTKTPTTFTPPLLFFPNERLIYLPNFLVMDFGTTPDVDYIITPNRRIVFTESTTDERLIYAGRNYLVVGDSATNEYVYIIKSDGEVEILDWDDATGGIQPINDGQAWLLGRAYGTDIILLGHTSNNQNAIYVILEDGTPVRITNSDPGVQGDDPTPNIQSGKIVKSGNNVFVAINYVEGGQNRIRYFKINLSPALGYPVYTPMNFINTGPTTLNPPRRGSYALDGNGRLYIITRLTPGDYFITTRFINASNILETTTSQPLLFTVAAPLPVMVAFANGVLISNDPIASTELIHVIGGGIPTNISLPDPVKNAVGLCNRVNNFSELILENSPAYAGIVQEPVAGEGTNNLMCASALFPNEFAWVKAEVSGPGTYDGRYVDDVNGPLPGDSHYLMATTNKMIFVQNPSLVANQTFQECTLGATSSICVTRNLTQPAYWRVYNPILGPFTFDKIKSDNIVISDGAGFKYFVAGGFWGGIAPNIRAAYFKDVVSAPYTANIQTGAVDTSTLNVVFSDAPARGGNISLGLDKAANVRRPISGAQCPSGLFDFVWYKDATRNFDRLTRPTNTCLITVLQVRDP